MTPACAWPLPSTDPPPVLWPADQRYIASFDGLRAIAVLLVIAYHTRGMLAPMPLGPWARVAASGWVGVDVFFTLSGFLITGILLRTRDHAHYLRNFYVRRLLRIFPLYYGVITLVMGGRVLAGADPSIHPWWSFYLYVSNVFVGRNQTEDFALDVSWSLSIEEQFYLLWPTLLLLLPPRAFRTMVVALIVGSPLVRWLVHDPSNIVSYTDTWCRLDALAIGAAGALLWHGHHLGAVQAARRLAPIALVAFAALLFSGWMDMRSLAWAVPGYSAVALCVATVLLALASDGLPRLRRLLTWRPLVHIGQVSYGVYLLHPLVLGVLHLVWQQLPVPAPSDSVGAAGLAYVVVPALSVAVATLVFRTIEAPMLALKDRWAPYR